MAQLTPPTITAEVIDRVKIKISGLSVANASAYQLRWGTLSGGGRVDTVQPDEQGSFLLDDCRARTTYFIAARALGDDENYENSNWSDELVIVTGQVVDSSLPVPTVIIGTTSLTYVQFSGLLYDRAYRYQISTSEATLADQPPRVIGSVNRIQGLEPGTTYYVRFCSVSPHSKCSLWGDTITFSTLPIVETLVVENTNDTGSGSLRQAIADAAGGTLITFAAGLSGGVINLGSSLSSNKYLAIDASGLEGGLTISFGSVSGRTITGENIHWRGITFRDGSTSTSSFFTGTFIDCNFSNIVNTANNGNYAIFLRANLYDCRISGCVVSNNTYTINTSYLDSCLISSCSGALMTTTSATNTYITGQNSTGRIITNNSQLTACLLTDCLGSGTNYLAYNGWAVETDYLDNANSYVGTATASMAGVTLYDCRVERNTSAANFAMVFTGTAYDSTFAYNTAVVGDGVGAAKLTRCKVIEAAERRATYNTPTMRDCLVIGEIQGGTYLNCTLSQLTSGTAHNCLLGDGSATGVGNNNVYYTAADATSQYSVSKVFVDYVAGDYRLTVGSPAINRGDNRYVSEGDTDLAGNPRIAGDTVDVGCYEFEAIQLAPPTFSVNIQQGGQVNIAYTLPEYADGFTLQYAADATFQDAHEVSSTATSFDLTGLSGNVWIRAKAVGISGKTLDSVWTTPEQIYVDTTAPIVTVDQTPIVMTYGADVDFLSGVSVVDDSGVVSSIKYRLFDADGPVVVDGEVFDIPSARIPKGRYELEIDATDALGNSGYALRSLTVLPPQIPTPTITLKSINGGTVVISGLLDSAAVGWVLSVDGVESDAVTNTGGQTTIFGLGDGTHLIKARAKGDYVDPDPPEQPSGDYRDSDWSNTLSVTIGGDAPVGVPTIRKTAITDHTLTLAVDGISGDMGYLEFYIATKFDFSDALVVTKLPQSTVTITGLKAATIYFIKARGVYATDKTDFSPWVATETLPLQATSPADKLVYVRSRICLLRDYLASEDSLSTVSIDGISETKADRAAIRAELAELEAEESRLMNGGGRLRTIDARWVI